MLLLIYHSSTMTVITCIFDKVQEAFGLKDSDFKEIVLNAVDLTFANDETKNVLRERIRARFFHTQ
jgi:adenosine deaminase